MTNIAMSYTPSRETLGLAATFEAVPTTNLLFWKPELKPVMDVLDEQQIDVMIIHEQFCGPLLEIIIKEFPNTEFVMLGGHSDLCPCITDMPELANVAQIHNGTHLKEFECDIAMFTENIDGNIHGSILNYLLNNYHVRMFGGQRINAPFYLGQITSKERADIIKSAKCVYDFDGSVSLDAGWLGTPSLRYTENDLGFKVAKDIGTLETELKLLLDNNFAQMREDYCNYCEELALQNNFFSSLSEFFKGIGKTEIGNDIDDKFKDLT